MVEVYLVQHGEARPESEDPARPLSDGGRAEVELVACRMAEAGVRPASIVHSGKLRAMQTAEILSRYLEPRGDVSERSGLNPLDEPEAAKQLIEGAGGPLMLVGHLPHLSRLASLLVSGNVDGEVVQFRMGGVVCLSEAGGNWLVKWAFIPEIAGD
jgi:phosphohistidine phosphatase